MKTEQQSYIDYLTNRVKLLEDSYGEYQELSKTTDNDDFKKAYSTLASGLWDQAGELKKALQAYIKIHNIKMETA